MFDCVPGLTTSFYEQKSRGLISKAAGLLQHLFADVLSFPDFIDWSRKEWNAFQTPKKMMYFQHMYIFAKFVQNWTINAFIACHLYLKRFSCMPLTC